MAEKRRRQKEIQKGAINSTLSSAVDETVSQTRPQSVDPTELLAGFLS